AYFRGHWYAAVKEESPVLIGVDATPGRMTVEFAETCDITFHYGFVNDAEEHATEPVTGASATFHVPAGAVYVRAEGATGEDEVSLTQPVMFNARPRPLAP